MQIIANDTWIVDPGRLICWNIDDDITVQLEQQKGHISGKLGEMSMETYLKLSSMADGDEYLHHILAQAQEFFCLSQNFQS